VTLAKDEGNRPDTTYEALAALRPVVEGASSRPGIRVSFPTVRPPAS